MKKFTLSLSLFYVLSYVFAPVAYGNFLNERYRGWYWFEEKNSRAEREESTALRKKAEDNARARQEVEAFAAELEEKRYAMFADPTLENVHTYRTAELEMWRRGMNLAENWVLANLRYPELFDRTEQPINVQGARLKREIEHKETTRAIEKTARNFDLVFFSREDCPYCRAFAPIIKKFAEH